MKKLVLSNIQSGVRKLGAVKATLEHMQEAYTEAIASMFTAFVAGAATPIAIHGCVNSGSGSNYNISAGAIYHNGEVFEIDAFVGTAGGGQVPVLSLATTWRAGDPAKYSDGSTHNTHSIRKYQWTFGASGSGLSDFSAVLTLKDRIYNEFLNIDAALAALVDSAPATLDTLNELAAALADDPNFATTVTNSIAGKVAKAGDTMSGALIVQQTIEAQGGIRTASSGVYLKKKVLDIPPWDMDLGLNSSVAHGIADFTKIRSVIAIVRNDDDTASNLFYENLLAGGRCTWSTTNINLTRDAGGVFDVPDYNSTAFNRGYLLVEYEV